MADLVSPGIQIREFDESVYVAATSDSVGGYAGHFNWGPIGVIKNISSEGQLRKIYGSPNYIGNTKYERSFYTAQSFLNYSNNLKVSRAASADAANSYASTGGATPIPDPYDGVSLSTVEEANGFIDFSNAVFAKYPGSLGDNLTILFVTNSNYDALDAVYKNAVQNVKPDTTDWANEYKGSTSTVEDEIHVIIIDKNRIFTTDQSAILESFVGLSTAINAKNSYGENNYFVDFINKNSSYIFLGPVDGQSTRIVNSNSGDLAALADYDGEITLTGGADGTHTAAAVTTALELFEDTTFSDIDLLFAENTSYESGSQSDIDAKLIEISSKRRDLIAFVSAPIDLYTQTSSADKLAAVLAKFTPLESSSYIVFDSTPGQVYNKDKDEYLWISLSGHMAGLCAYTDDVADPWFSPAGLNRGQLRSVVKLAFNANQTDRDELYNNRINPIISLPGQGITLFGDKTGQKKPSAFDRINVRRLFNVVEKRIAETARFSLFEQNDSFTRAAFVNTITPYLREVQSRRGISSYRVVCDESNNTPEVVDSNRLVASIYIAPVHSVNFITINFIATRTGSTFVEIGG